LVFGALGGALALHAQTPGRQDTVRLVLRPESRLWLEGDSNLHEWSCDAKEIVPNLTLDRAGPSTAPTRVERATMTVRVAAIECGNGKMNENLRKALESDAHPNIVFTVSQARFVDTGDEGQIAVVAVGELTVAGTTRPLELSVTGSDTGKGALRLVSRTEIRMTDFGVDPPRALLGLLKTKDEVVILFDLVMGYGELETRLSPGG
jgi:hypothetical protein